MITCPLCRKKTWSDHAVHKSVELQKQGSEAVAEAFGQFNSDVKVGDDPEKNKGGKKVDELLGAPASAQNPQDRPMRNPQDEIGQSGIGVPVVAPDAPARNNNLVLPNEGGEFDDADV